MKNTVTALPLALALVMSANTALSQQTTMPSSLSFDVTFSPFNLLDLGAKGISVGDQLLFDDELYQNGEQVGRDGGFCVITRVQPESSDPLLDQCLATFSLPDGQIVVQGLVSDAPKKIMAIIGGTGKYVGVHGQVTLEEFGNGKGRVTFEFSQ